MQNSLAKPKFKVNKVPIGTQSEDEGGMTKRSRTLHQEGDTMDGGKAGSAGTASIKLVLEADSQLEETRFVDQTLIQKP